VTTTNVITPLLLCDTSTHKQANSPWRFLLLFARLFCSFLGQLCVFLLPRPPLGSRRHNAHFRRLDHLVLAHNRRVCSHQRLRHDSLCSYSCCGGGRCCCRRRRTPRRGRWGWRKKHAIRRARTSLPKPTCNDRNRVVVNYVPRVACLRVQARWGGEGRVPMGRETFRQYCSSQRRSRCDAQREPKEKRRKQRAHRPQRERKENKKGATNQLTRHKFSHVLRVFIVGFTPRSSVVASRRDAERHGEMSTWRCRR
jgi:hypothetical protein